MSHKRPKLIATSSIAFICILLGGISLIRLTSKVAGLTATTHSAPVPTMQLDFSKTLDARKFGFSGHPGDVEKLCVSHCMMTIVMPTGDAYTLEVGMWQLFQREGKVSGIVLYSPATNLDDACRLARDLFSRFELPGVQQLEAWRAHWDTSQGILQQDRGAISNSDNWSTKRVVHKSGVEMHVEVGTTASGYRSNGSTAVWSTALVKSNYHF